MPTAVAFDRHGSAVPSLTRLTRHSVTAVTSYVGEPMTTQDRLRLYLGFTAAAYVAALLVLALGPGGPVGGAIVLVWVAVAIAFKMNAIKAYKDLHR